MFGCGVALLLFFLLLLWWIVAGDYFPMMVRCFSNDGNDTALHHELLIFWRYAPPSPKNGNNGKRDSVFALATGFLVKS